MFQRFFFLLNGLKDMVVMIFMRPTKNKEFGFWKTWGLKSIPLMMTSHLYSHRTDERSILAPIPRRAWVDMMCHIPCLMIKLPIGHHHKMRCVRSILEKMIQDSGYHLRKTWRCFHPTEPEDMGDLIFIRCFWIRRKINTRKSRRSRFMK